MQLIMFEPRTSFPRVDSAQRAARTAQIEREKNEETLDLEEGMSLGVADPFYLQQFFPRNAKKVVRR